jgi:hypothetical protein
VKYETAVAFRAALEARLKSAEDGAVGTSRLRKRVASERLLARLLAIAPDDWVLKGGFALELRLGAGARATKDIDIDWILGEEAAVELLLKAAALVLDDRFGFSVERSLLNDDLPGGGQRWAVTVTLAGREFERVAIDIGFAAAPVFDPETIASSHLLDFAGVKSVGVPALAIEQHVAEKLHAYSRTYARGLPSSRVKDLIDIVLIAHTTALDADRLTRAIAAIFARRATHEIPRTLPSPPPDWEGGWRRLAVDVPADDDLWKGHAAAAALLDPVLTSEVISGAWDPDDRTWKAP